MNPYQQFANTLKKLSFYIDDSRNIDPPYFILEKLPKIYYPNLKKINSDSKTKETTETTEKIITIPEVLNENFQCNLCKDKVYAVKNYFKKPESKPSPILVLYYNASPDSKKLPRDNSDKYYFSSKEEDELFERMLNKINLSLKNLYFQEFVACHFSPNSSSEDWEQRAKNCYYLLEKNIEEFRIEQILLVGYAALLLLGKEAIHLAKNSKIIPLNVKEKQIPAMVIRSPLALLTLEQKRKEYENALKKYPQEYEMYLKNKNQLEVVIQEIQSLVANEKETKVINNVKLRPASQINSEKQLEEKIKKQLGIQKYTLYLALKLRKEEIQIKQQILNSFNQLIK
jgi:uracil-DNA glycosylase family 4